MISKRVQGLTESLIREMILIRDVGVATVPGSPFYAHRELGRTVIRFRFPKTDDVLVEAARRLLKLAR